MLSKTATCTLPPALLLVLWWKQKRIRWSDVRALAPLFVIAIVLGVITIRMEKAHVGAAGEDWDLSVVERCLVAGRILWFYAGKLLWPTQLTLIYPRWQIDAGAWLQYLFPIAALLVLIALWLGRARLGRGPLVAVLFFAGTLVPVLGFFNVYMMRFSFVADHFQYLASVGIIALAVAAAHRVAHRFGPTGKRGAAVVLAGVLGTLGALTWQQVHVYADLETLWRDTLRKNPHAWMAHNNLAIVLQGQGRLDEAIAHFQKALKIKPDHANAHSNLGAALGSRGRLDEAIAHFRQALLIDPQHADARRNLTKALAAKERLEAAPFPRRDADPP
jgi:tetratricopeptide (TPR) repeat protein